MPLMVILVLGAMAQAPTCDAETAVRVARAQAMEGVDGPVSDRVETIHGPITWNKLTQLFPRYSRPGYSRIRATVAEKEFYYIELVRAQPQQQKAMREGEFEALVAVGGTYVTWIAKSNCRELSHFIGR